MKKNLTHTGKSAIAALCIALSVVLPMLFHSIPDAGSVYSPIHIPSLLCGLVAGWQYGLLAGLLGPLFSSMLTGMPPMAYLPPMMVECAMFGLITGLCFRFVKTGRCVADIYISLSAAMVLGRVIAGISRSLIFARGSYSMAMFLSSYFVVGIPGIILHLVLVPILYLTLERARLIPPRYSKVKP